MRLSVLSWAAATSFLCGSALGQDVLIESLPGIPEGWTRISDADPEQLLHLRVALVQPNVAQFEQTLLDVSTPGHPQYGKHLSSREVQQMLKPHADSTHAVLDWLATNGITEVNNKGDWINFVTTVEKANDMLHTSFGVFEHGNVHQTRALNYSLPHDLASHVSMIAPITRFSTLKTMRSHIMQSNDIFQETAAPLHDPASFVPPFELNEADCNVSITPECLRALYNIGPYKASPNATSRLGISGFLEEYPRFDMLANFTQKYAPYADSNTFLVDIVNGGGNDQNAGSDSSEANLDVQYGLSLSFQTPVSYYSTGGRGPLVPDLDQPNPQEVSNEPYLELLEFLLGLHDSQLPQVLTTSYGENEQSVPRLYNEKVCQMFGQLGARGVSVIFASGDSGPGTSCERNDGTNQTRFMPTFPAACPWVTSVGATQYVKPEKAVGFSSGGFSDIYGRPSYQNASVQAYLDKLGNKWAGLYNGQGRGFPDVAAQGKNFNIFDKGANRLVDGTSASAPVFAALVSLLNNARLQSGQPPLGFLNPWLYQQAAAGFTDIVEGGSRGCRGRYVHGLNTSKSIVPYASWNATEGWDPVTGLGTPLFDKLLELSTPGFVMPKIQDEDSA